VQRQSRLEQSRTPMGASACRCKLPPGARLAAEEIEIAHPEVDSQAQPTLLQKARARSSSETSERSFKRACLEDSWRSSTVAELPSLAVEASPQSRDRAFTECPPSALSQSRDRAFTEPVKHLEPKGKERSGSTASGLSTSLLWTAQLTLSFIRKLQKAQIPRATKAAHPDFSGDWLLHRLEGDAEAMLKEVGASWAKRKAAAAMGFGVGREFIHVDQYPDEIHIDRSYRSMPGTLAELAKPTCHVYNTDGTEQDITDPEGRTVRTSVIWDGEALSMVSERVENGGFRPLPSTRRYLQGDGEELVIEQTSPATGVAVKRIYRRCEFEASGGKAVKSSVTQCK